MILNVYFEDWNAETMVISYGLIHGLGGASVSLNLATISYMGDVSTPETKVHLKKAVNLRQKAQSIRHLVTSQLSENTGFIYQPFCTYHYSAQDLNSPYKPFEF